MSHNILIMGAAGKDFHVFNTCYRDNAAATVVAFTATQIPHIDDRRYPSSLAGPNYPEGIGIYPEEELEALIAEHAVDEVVFAYSDVNEDYLAVRRALVEGAGARFSLFDVDATMIRSSKPVIAVCAVRTGCGKSQTSRKVVSLLRERGLNTIAIRHPMPYGDLAKQAVQRFATLEDMVAHDCTIEEMEEYEPHITNGAVVYAGVDYGAILAEAEQEADVILWDGGNNDTPFYKPDLWITVADPHRPGHELNYFPGTENFTRADLILINKVDTAEEAGTLEIEANASRLNPEATLVRAASPVSVADPSAIAGKRVLVVE
ncbi:MAG: GTPase, partial [Planctomycetota bacterium]|nr:GTPase [Planctomycetota bacterium]